MINLSTTPKTGNWNILGHEWAVDMLQQHIAREAVRHAYLFTGPPGLGRRTLALHFAQALNCTQPPAPGDACGVCRECKQIDAMAHPDLDVVQVLPDKTKISIEQVRETRRTLVLKPYQSKYRVAVFLRFQESSEGAANALLKTLEEAPAHAILILTADSPEQLLPTITSRCEVLRLRPLSVDAVENHLLAHSAEAESASLIAHISNGRPGYALRLLNDESALEFRSEKLADLHGLLSSTRVQKFKYAEALAKDKDAMRETLHVWLSYWRDVLMYVSQAAAPIANIDQTKNIESISKLLDLGMARQAALSMEHGLKRLEHNVNTRLVAEVLLLDLPEI